MRAARMKSAAPHHPCYTPRRVPVCREMRLRDWRIQVREWAGKADAPTLFLLHGWADTSATFQFLADQLPDDWHLIAPDLRGFGGSQRAGATYWFAEYLADLESLLNAMLPENEPALLLGHSLGGNIAMFYAGVRPARVRAVISLDAFGLPDMPPELAPRRMAAWLDQMAAPVGFRVYPDFDALAARLRLENPHTPEERIRYLAQALGARGEDGQVHLAMDPAHRYFSPALYRAGEAHAYWRQVCAPTLWIVQEDAQWRRTMLKLDDAQYRAATECFRDFEEVRLPACGHNMHHSRPEAVAQAVVRFLARTGAAGNTP